VIQNVTLREDAGVITIAGSGFDGELAVTVDGQAMAVLPGGTDTQTEVLALPSVLQTPAGPGVSECWPLEVAGYVD
jgi:hypothetical protein